MNLIDQKEPLFNFSNKNEVKNYNQINIKKKYSKKVLKPNPVEIELHKEYLKSLNKKNFY